MAKTVTLREDFLKGIWKENPVLASLLGLCPTLAVTNAAMNGLAMGLATTFVLVCSSLMVSSMRNIIPHQVRIASYIVVIATFVTVADRFLAAYLPDISKSLGPYIPLIVVNCLILGRQEAFSSKRNPGRALVDALGMGIGFIMVLVTLGVIREILGAGTVFGVTVLGDWFDPWMVMILPPGAFLTLGVLLGLMEWVVEKRAKREASKEKG